MAKVRVRDISPMLQKFRDFLLGRSHTKNLRFPADVASRSPDPPQIPDGSAHKLNNNYYYARDFRRAVKPPVVILKATKAKAIETGKGGCPPVASKKEFRKVLPLPGPVYHWD